MREGEGYRKGRWGERDGESFSALSGWNNWHFSWKELGSLDSLDHVSVLFTL